MKLFNIFLLAVSFATFSAAAECKIDADLTTAGGTVTADGIVWESGKRGTFSIKSADGGVLDISENDILRVRIKTISGGDNPLMVILTPNQSERKYRFYKYTVKAGNEILFRLPVKNLAKNGAFELKNAKVWSFNSKGWGMKPGGDWKLLFTEIRIERSKPRQLPAAGQQ